MKQSLSVLALLLLLTACATQGKPARPAAELPGAAAPLVAENVSTMPRGVIPPGTAGVKVGLMLPLSGDSAVIGTAMLDAATMALSDTYLTAPSENIRAKIVLLPKDTGATAADTRIGAKQLIDQGAQFIIGPLFSVSVTAVEPLTQEKGITMLTFSNNSAIAKKGVYTFGFLPEQQVKRMAEYTYLHNLQRVGLLAPNDAYGEKIKAALIEAYTQKGGVVMPVELYAPSPANIDAAVARMMGAYNNTTEDRKFQAIYIADGGNQLRNIISSLKKNNVDLKKIKLLGAGLWDDPEILKIPEMQGAWFPSSPAQPYQIFEKRFFATYGYKPTRLASLSYDAVALVAQLAMTAPNGVITNEMMTPVDGFVSPANALFRLTPAGISQRRLAIMEVTPDGFKVLDPALKSFKDAPLN